MKVNNLIIYCILLIVLIVCIYLLLGSFGLLPKWFYQQCENIDLETAQLRGCCEDRSKYEPTSWLFGEENCDKYRNKEELKQMLVEK